MTYTGKIVKWSESVFDGKWPRNHFIGTRTVTAEVKKENIRKDRQKSLVLIVQHSTGTEPLYPGQKTVRLMKNVIYGLKEVIS
jgi:hypothetical protein